MNIQSANRAAAVSPQTIEARCPHGGMPGSCPSCSGGGGGGGGAAKKSTAGLMGWNEAYAVWKSIQTGKTREADYQKAVTGNQQGIGQEGFVQTLRMTAALMLARFVQNLMVMNARMQQAVVSMARAVGQVLSSVQNVFVQAGRQLLGLGQNITQLMASVGEKLASILGDTKKLLEDILHHNVENLKALFARLAFVERMQQIRELAAKVFRQFMPRQVFRAVSRRIKSLLGGLKKLFGGRNNSDPSPETGAPVI